VEVHDAVGDRRDGLELGAGVGVPCAYRLLDGNSRQLSLSLDVIHDELPAPGAGLVEPRGDRRLGVAGHTEAGGADPACGLARCLGEDDPFAIRVDDPGVGQRGTLPRRRPRRQEGIADQDAVCRAPHRL